MFRYIEKKIAEDGFAPTVRELMEAFGINSPNGVMCHLKALRRKEVIAWRDGHARTLRPLV